MPTFKSLEHFERRLEKSICWGDWIKIKGKIYKMVEYGDLQNGNYMLFQNKPTTNIVRVEYQVPTAHYDKNTKERIEGKKYSFRSVEEYENGELYRY